MKNKNVIFILLMLYCNYSFLIDQSQVEKRSEILEKFILF